MKVAIIMGSDSDWPKLKGAAELLEQFGIGYEAVVASAHRTPAKAHEFASTAREKGFGVIIAAAGAAAHLAGVVAAYTTLPVVGVPINATSLNGMDALLAMVQMPSGIPVGTMAVDGAKNAAIYAAQILGVQDAQIAEKLSQYKVKMAQEVEQKDARLQAQLSQA